MLLPSIHLNESFFLRPTTEVAQELLGARMVWEGKPVIITETEAYVGKDDPACHAARGRTKRNEVMFGKPGLVYVYLIYGMYHCLNIVTEQEDFPAAVLIRGVVDLAAPQMKLDGPGKLCRYLQIHREHNYVDVTTSPNIYFEPTSYQQELPYDATPRIGISQGQDKLWRYVVTKEGLIQLRSAV